MSRHKEQPWVLTHSGKRVNLLDPRPEDVWLEDIAFALARLNRFTGHADPSWTVGQHSLFCAELARIQGGSLELQRSCLIHDFAEAYLGDVSSPLKACISGYRSMEVLHFHAICKALGLSVEEEWMHDHQPKVKAIDQRAFEIEVQTFMPPHPDLPAMKPIHPEERRALMSVYDWIPVRVDHELRILWLDLREQLKGAK